MKYEIEVKEVLKRIVTVEADSIDEAVETVADMYNKQEIVLGPEDMADFYIDPAYLF